MYKPQHSQLSLLFCDVAVKEMVQEIEQCQGLQSLRLEGNTLGVEAAQAIAKSLEGKRELEVGLKCHWKIFTL